MTGRTEDIVVGVLCLLVIVPGIAWTIRRGVRDGRLPIGRGYVLRDERPGPFKALLASYALAILLIAFIGLDLLFGIRG